MKKAKIYTKKICVVILGDILPLIPLKYAYKRLHCWSSYILDDKVSDTYPW